MLEKEIASSLLRARFWPIYGPIVVITFFLLMVLTNTIPTPLMDAVKLIPAIAASQDEQEKSQGKTNFLLQGICFGVNKTDEERQRNCNPPPQ